VKSLTSIDIVLDLFQLGVSEKVALVMHAVSGFIVGFAIAYACSWRLALALTSMLPFMAMSGALMTHFVSKYTQ